MADVRQQIAAGISQAVKKAFPRDRVITAHRAAATAVLEDIKRTARSGISTSGGQFPTYTDRYRSTKARYIATGRIGRRSVRRTSEAARAVNDRTVLSGRLHSDMQVTSLRLGKDTQYLEASFVYTFKSQRSRDIAGYLQEKGYNFIWLSKGSTAAGRRQRSLYLKELKSALGFSGGGSAQLSED